jgi:outer membrane biosynthesis protein TonB
VSLDARLPVLAAAIGVAVLVLGGGFLMLGRGQSSSNAAVPVIKPLHPVRKHVTTAPKQATAKKVVAAKKVAVTKTVTAVKVKPAVKPASKPKPVAKPKHTPAVIDGMPSALALALRAHPVVVVSLFTPDASVDAMATAEAKHGAEAAHVGFVAFNVADNKIVAPLSALLAGAPTPADRVLDGPAVLVFERPSTLFVRFNGFADRDTVAQAAANAVTLSR